MNDLHEWFQKNDLCPENILYLYRSDRKTVVHRMDGEEAALYAPLHSVLSVLPENLFLNISKGIAVCRSQIVNISIHGLTFTMPLLYLLPYQLFTCLRQEHSFVF